MASQGTNTVNIAVPLHTPIPSTLDGTVQYYSHLASQRYPDHSLDVVLESSSEIQSDEAVSYAIVNKDFEMLGPSLHMRVDAATAWVVGGRGSRQGSWKPGFSFVGINAHVRLASPTTYLMELQTGHSMQRVIIEGMYHYPENPPPKLKSIMKVDRAAFTFYDNENGVAHFDAEDIHTLEEESSLRFNRPSAGQAAPIFARSGESSAMVEMRTPGSDTWQQEIHGAGHGDGPAGDV